MYCLEGTVLVSVLSTGLQMYCLEGAVVVSVLSTGLQMYCLEGTVLGVCFEHVHGAPDPDVLSRPRRFGCLF